MTLATMYTAGARAFVSFSRGEDPMLALHRDAVEIAGLLCMLEEAWVDHDDGKALGHSGFFRVTPPPRTLGVLPNS